MVAPWLGNVRPFTLDDPAQMRMVAPPAPSLNSVQYTNDYNEVKAIGKKTGSTRNPDQTALAMFFSDNAVGYWNRTLRSIVDPRVMNVGDSAAYSRW
jgi:hypothetical protein